MNARRINDILKIVGAFAAAFTALAAVLPGKFSMVFASIGTAGAFLAGFGTRAAGTEYQDVADAKAVAKAVTIAPPPMAAVVNVTAVEAPKS